MMSDLGNLCIQDIVLDASFFMVYVLVSWWFLKAAKPLTFIAISVP